MRQEVEIEFKNLLTEEEYLKLKHVYFKKSDRPLIQNNYYFDTSEYTLKDHKCALRIRTKNTIAEMTLKTPFKGHHTETTIDLDINEAQKIIREESFILPDEMISVLNDEGISIHPKVSVIAQLRTDRLEVESAHTIIVLDRSTYSGHIDYELEIESDSESIGKDLFTKILNEQGIPVRPTSNKIARAFNAKAQKHL